jgi:hypothetical protein
MLLILPLASIFVGTQVFAETIRVDNHVTGLRAKLKQDASQREQIRTVHGVDISLFRDTECYDLRQFSLRGISGEYTCEYSRTKRLRALHGRPGIADAVLCQAIRDAERGPTAADLGGGVIKRCNQAEDRASGRGQIRWLSCANYLFHEGAGLFRPRICKEPKAQHQRQRTGRPRERLERWWR